MCILQCGQAKKFLAGFARMCIVYQHKLKIRSREDLTKVCIFNVFLYQHMGLATEEGSITGLNWLSITSVQSLDDTEGT